MGREIELCTKEFCLRIRLRKNKWYDCELVKGNKIVRLGAESIEYLRNNLLAGIDDSPKRMIGQLHGYAVFGVLTLAETYYALYMANTENGKIMLWQDKRTNEVIDTLHILPEECIVWREQLANWAHSPSEEPPP